MAVLHIGDAVQVKKGTSLWMQYAALRQALGRVTGAVPAGTAADRITVAYPDGTKLLGVDVASFTRAKL